jgi:hypothetical protein
MKKAQVLSARTQRLHKKGWSSIRLAHLSTSSKMVLGSLMSISVKCSLSIFFLLLTRLCHVYKELQSYRSKEYALKKE